MRRRTLCLWLGYAGQIAAFYFANTWTAKLIADVSGDPALGVRIGALMLFAGVFGALVFAGLSIKMRPRLVTVLMLVGGASSFVLYGAQIGNVGIAFTLAILVGLFSAGGNAAFYAISPFVYPTAARGMGVGLMIGFGRGVAILAPIATGYMLKAGWTPQMVYQFFGGVLALAAVAMTLLDASYRGRSEDPETPEAVRNVMTRLRHTRSRPA